MTEQPKLSGATALLLIQAAAVLQVIVIVLLAVDRITSSVAIPLLALVLIFGLIPAGIFAKSTK